MPSGTTKVSPQGGGFHVRSSSGLLDLCMKCMLSSATGTYHSTLGSNQGNRQKPVILGGGGLLTTLTSDQPLKQVLHMPGAGFLLDDL